MKGENRPEIFPSFSGCTEELRSFSTKRPLCRLSDILGKNEKAEVMI